MSDPTCAYPTLCESCKSSARHNARLTQAYGWIIDNRRYRCVRSSPSKARKCSECGRRYMLLFKLVSQ